MFFKRGETLPSSRSCFAVVGFLFLLVPIITCTEGESVEYAICPYVMGGSDAPEGRFPYMCSIRRIDNLEHACGGTLIKERWVLTAAHCLDPNFSTSTGVGSLVYCDTHRKNEYNRSKTYSIDTIHAHGKWDSKLEKGCDIALIKLDRVANISVPMLPRQSYTYPIRGGYSVLGWGATDLKRCTDKLQIGIDLQVEFEYNCSKKDVWGGNITHCMICAGGGSLDTAKGDSGGPFLQLDEPLGYLKDGDPSLDLVVGITSFGIPEGLRETIEKPGVYTNVGFFRDWIDCIVEEKRPKRECDAIPVGPGKSVVLPQSSVSPPIIEKSPPPEKCARLKKSEKIFNEKDALKRMKEAIEKEDSFVVKCILDERLLDANMMYLVIVDLLPSYTSSLLHLAALHNAIKSTEVLVDHEAEIDIRDGQERTPLHTAAEHGSLDVAEVLVREGANFDATAKRGDSPLHFAAYYGHESVIEFLAKREADVNFKNVNEQTPLHMAAAKGFVSIVELLLDNEASKVETDESGETPFDVICKNVDRNAECNEETRTRLEDLLSID